MNTNIANIGNTIRQERLLRGMTQEELGQRIGVGKSQISKIERGKGLTIKTVQKVLDALNLTATIRLEKPVAINKNIINYIVANIGEFADTHNLTVREASNYLNRYKGIEFLTEHYEAEHQLSLYDSTQDLTRVCNNNGGGIEYSPHGQTNKKSLHLIDGITNDIIAYLMEDNQMDISSAISLFYNSETFAKLSDESTGLYIESSAYVYEILKGEMKMGRITQL